MTAARQAWLVAVREMRERSRSRAFRASVLVMLLVVVGVIVLPTVITTGGGTRDVGLAGPADTIPATLASTVVEQGAASGMTVRVRELANRTDGEAAVRSGDIDVLVVDGSLLEWRRRPDDALRGVVTGAIQMVAVRERAAAAGITTEVLRDVIAPVVVESRELAGVAGRSPDDETAAIVMTILLFISITTFGNLVLTGVVEEKASRVVEVLLARMPARNLLLGKVVGIGLLGLAQIAVTAGVALVAVSLADSVHVPAARGAVLAWAVGWFVLGYALYAVVYGAIGSLASRTEDAQSVAGPLVAVLLAAYFVSFVAVGRPESTFAKVISFVPATAPLSMPSRIAMGATAWWEPVVAGGLMIATIAALVELGGRVYANAILQTGPAVRLRHAWRGSAAHADGSHCR